MASFRTFENKLRDFLINKAKTSNETAAAIRKFSNIRISMNHQKYDRPHFIIKIGISEAAFDIDSGLILSGGLGPESQDVRNWVMKYLKKTEMKGIWQTEYKGYLARLELEQSGSTAKKND